MSAAGAPAHFNAMYANRKRALSLALWLSHGVDVLGCLAAGNQSVRNNDENGERSGPLSKNGDSKTKRNTHPKACPSMRRYHASDTASLKQVDESGNP